MGNSKWIKVSDLEQPLAKVARKSLRNRLGTVARFAPLAAYNSGDDVKYVHRLRVSTRRAQAAFSLFSDLLTKKEARWMKHRLRSLRKAAGDARDLDVLSERFNKYAKIKMDKDWWRFEKRMRKLRKKAQEPLVDVVQDLERTQFDKRCRALEEKVRWRWEVEPEPTFCVAARARLRPMVNEFLVEARSNLPDIDAMHDLRISAKRLRYAMELLWGAFDDAFRSQLYPALKQVQEEIGPANDRATSVAMLNRWMRQSKRPCAQKVLAKLIKKEQKQLNQEFSTFRDRWTVSRIQRLTERFEATLD